MSERYEASQLPDLHLPGFRSEATIWDIAGTETDWQPVLSLSIYSHNLDDPEQLDVLTAIRTEGTRTHPGVISTPTGRFPHSFQLPLLESRRDLFVDKALPHSVWASEESTSEGFRLDDINVTERAVIAEFMAGPQDLPDLDDPLSFLAHETLERKLGLGDAMHDREGTGPIGSVSLSEVVAGFGYPADDPETGAPLWEPLLMYGAVMMLHDRGAIPESTASYRDIGWTPMEDFKAGHVEKRPDRLVPGIKPEDEATVCVRGLCLDTTGVVTANPELPYHLGIR